MMKGFIAVGPGVVGTRPTTHCLTPIAGGVDALDGWPADVDQVHRRNSLDFIAMVTVLQRCANVAFTLSSSAVISAYVASRAAAVAHASRDSILCGIRM
jgi:hypothetical protein